MSAVRKELVRRPDVKAKLAYFRRGYLKNSQFFFLLYQLNLFINHLLRYPNIHKTTVHFCGSVAWHLKDVLQGLCEQYDIKVGKIMQKPIKGLAGYYAD